MFSTHRGCVDLNHTDQFDSSQSVFKMVRFVWEGGGGEGRGVLIFTMESQKLAIEKKIYF